MQDDEDTPVWQRLLKGIGQLLIGMVSLFLLTAGTPEPYRWVCMGGVFVIGLIIIVQKYI